MKKVWIWVCTFWILSDFSFSCSLEYKIFEVDILHGWGIHHFLHLRLFQYFETCKYIYFLDEQDHWSSGAKSIFRNNNNNNSNTNNNNNKCLVNALSALEITEKSPNRTLVSFFIYICLNQYSNVWLSTRYQHNSRNRQKKLRNNIVLGTDKQLFLHSFHARSTRVTDNIAHIG